MTRILPLEGDVKGRGRRLDATDTLPISTTGTSALASFSRSLILFLGLMFRRPSKLFRPSRVDTWAGLRQLALSANQTLSPAFIRSLVRSKSGALAVGLAIVPPLLINTTLGFLLFTSHSFFALSLVRIPFFHHIHHNTPESLDSLTASPSPGLDCDAEELINIHTLMMGPTIIPNHPTILSAIAGAGAGLVQGAAFTPIENIVRLLRDSATGLSSIVIKVLRLPFPQLPLNSTPFTTISTSPVQALRTFMSSDAWRRSPSWWTGWRWTMARDAISYSVFFAAFDLTRRAGLRVKALFGGPIQAEWSGFLSINPASTGLDKSQKASSPTLARIAQATTIVAGGVTASLAAEFASRPIRACQRIIETSSGQSKPVYQVFRTQGLKPFVRNPTPSQVAPLDGRLTGALKRVGWRMAAVGPWGFGFLVWAYVGGEV